MGRAIEVHGAHPAGQATKIWRAREAIRTLHGRASRRAQHRALKPLDKRASGPYLDAVHVRNELLVLAQKQPEAAVGKVCTTTTTGSDIGLPLEPSCFSHALATPMRWRGSNAPLQPAGCSRRGKHTHAHARMHTYTQTDTHTDRQTDRHTHIHTMGRSRTMEATRAQLQSLVITCIEDKRQVAKGVGVQLARTVCRAEWKG